MSRFNYEAATRRAIKLAGGNNALARKLGIKPQAVSQWKRVPVERVLEIEGLTEMTREQLRPDIYPVE